MPYTVERKPSFECLKDIARIVKARIRNDVPVRVDVYGLGQGDTLRNYVRLTYQATGTGPKEWIEAQHEPGIPPASLVPEKIGPIAYWILAQLQARYPDWFIKDNITPLP